MQQAAEKAFDPPALTDRVVDHAGDTEHHQSQDEEIADIAQQPVHSLPSKGRAFMAVKWVPGVACLAASHASLPRVAPV